MMLYCNRKCLGYNYVSMYLKGNLVFGCVEITD